MEELLSEVRAMEQRLRGLEDQIRSFLGTAGGAVSDERSGAVSCQPAGIVARGVRARRPRRAPGQAARRPSQPGRMQIEDLVAAPPSARPVAPPVPSRSAGKPGLSPTATKMAWPPTSRPPPWPFTRLRHRGSPRSPRPPVRRVRAPRPARLVRAWLSWSSTACLATSRRRRWSGRSTTSPRRGGRHRRLRAGPARPECQGGRSRSAGSTGW